jgi:hypothetical protein
MRRASCFALALLCLAAFAAPALAQKSGGPSPYSPTDLGPPVGPDGKLNWPTFFKSQKFELYYQHLWMTGSCRGTNPDITVPATQNRMDVDAMPEGTVSGRVVRVALGTLDVRSDNGLVVTVLTHPAGVSRVSVKGDVPAASLQPGMVVRFTGSVNQRGEGQEPLSALDVVSLPADFEYPAVEPGASRVITAKVVALRKQQLQLQVDAGSLRRLRYQLDESAVARVDGKDLALAAVGDIVTAQGHLYSSLDGKKPQNFVFASDVTVEKPAIVKAAAAATAARR